MLVIGRSVITMVQFDADNLRIARPSELLGNVKVNGSVKRAKYRVVLFDYFTTLFLSFSCVFMVVAGGSSTVLYEAF